MQLIVSWNAQESSLLRGELIDDELQTHYSAYDMSLRCYAGVVTVLQVQPMRAGCAFFSLEQEPADERSGSAQIAHVLGDASFELVPSKRSVALNFPLYP